MIEVGRGRINAAEISAILASGDRARAPAAAAFPTGLYLTEVRYYLRGPRGNACQ